MQTIEIDFDVFKAIQTERNSFEDTPNTVLRRMLGIDEKSHERDTEDLVTGHSWERRGALLPHGTKLRMNYRGQTYTGSVHNGRWMINGNFFSSPSAAASGVAVTKSGGRTQLDGWKYWEVQVPDNAKWVALSELRTV